MKDEPHIEAAKMLANYRLSSIQKRIDERPLSANLDQLVRLVLELQEAAGQKLIEAANTPPHI